jgi:hypothetical protein
VPPVLNLTASLPSNWGMMGNDRIGDCTIAGAGHLIMSWSGNESKKETIIPDNIILKVYSAISGYNPVTGENDNGCALLDVLNYWRKKGIGGDLITAFMKLVTGDINQVKQSVYLFGGVYIGLALPDGLNFENSLWSIPKSGPVGQWTPDPNQGHCVCILGYDDLYLYFISWGKVYRMTYAFYQTYNDESYAILSTDWCNTQSPEGFNLPTLQKDLAMI